MPARLSVEEVQLRLSNRGFVWLGGQYRNCFGDLLLRCRNGHEIKNSIDEVKKQTYGCQICALKERSVKRREWTIDRIQKEVADKRNGKVLSLKYDGLSNPLEWQCVDGHLWSASLNSVNGCKTWCPKCSRAIGLGERITRGYLEHFLKTKFPRTKNRTWLKGYELDGYNEGLKLAFEYNGYQHYRKSHFKVNLIARQRADAEKKQILKSFGIMLIVIHHRIKYKNIGKYVHMRLVKLRLITNTIVPTIDEIGPFKVGILNEVRAIAIERGGKCLSKTYIDSKTPLEFECENKHRWQSFFGTIRNGSWCKECAGRMNYSIDLAMSIAKSRNGVCLSKRYRDNKQKLKWKCEFGHVWRAVLSSVRHGRWCMKCYRSTMNKSKLHSMEYIKEIEKKTGFKFQDDSYLGCNYQHRWLCKNGHEIRRAPKDLNRGKVSCIICSPSNKNRTLTIQAAKAWAMSKGGECLSSEYANRDTRLVWKCKDGHIWEVSFGAIRNGHWCRKCYNLRQRRKDKLVV